MTKKRCKVLVCCHKKDVMATQEPYMPIHVGKALHPDVDLGIQGDDTGDNISLKNGSYCELTGMYWAWKNLKDVDVIGLCHYRRYFDFHGQCRRFRPVDIFPSDKFDKTNITIPDRFLDRLKDGEAVVASPHHYMNNIYFDYCCCHYSDDFRVMQKIVVNTQPKEMQDAFYKIMYMNNLLSPTNMFIMTWKDFDEYCTFMFGILEEVEKYTDVSHYSPYQSRLYGFLSERLFNVWLYGKRMKLFKRPIIWFFDEPQMKDLSTFTILQRNFRGWLNVRLSNMKMQELSEFSRKFELVEKKK